jgi:FkbM family methyltransferase
MANYEPVDWVAPRKDEIFLDIGGYIGWYTIRAAKAVGTSGKVIALEPDDLNRMQLETNLKLNHLQNVQVLSSAIWSSSGEVCWRHESQPVWHRVDQSETGEFREAISVDDLVTKMGLTRLDWIKMDIEGGEVQALQGAARTLRLHRPALFIEIHKTREQAGTILRELGYVIEREQYDERPDLHGWILAKSR